MENFSVKGQLDVVLNPTLVITILAILYEINCLSPLPILKEKQQLSLYILLEYIII